MFDDWVQNPTRELTLFSVILVLRGPGSPLSSYRFLLLTRILFCMHRGVCGLRQNAERESVSGRGYVEPRTAAHTVAGELQSLRPLTKMRRICRKCMEAN